MYKYLVGLISFVISLPVAAQPNPVDILFERIPIPGLIHSSQINDMVQDQHGLLWFAADGLFRYDGYKFHAYSELSATQSLGGKEIIALLADIHGKKLYLGTHTYGLVEYDYDTERFRAIPAKGGAPIISLITQTQDGTIWCGSFSNGVYYLENDSLKKLPDPNKLFSNPTCLLPVGNKVYVDKLKNIYVLKNKVIEDTIKLSYPGYEMPIYTRVTAMNFNATGQLWIGTERAGVLLYDTLSKTFIKYFSPDKVPFHHRINRIITSRNGLVWILTKANGLVVYNPATESLSHFTKNPISDRSLSGNNCTAIVQDKTGIIWVGSTGDLNKYDPAKLKFKHIYNTPFSTISLYDNMVRGVYEDQYEKLWIGTDGGVAHVYDRTNNALEKIPVTVKGVTQHIVPVYFHDYDANTLLVGTSIGLLAYDRSTKTFNFFKPLENSIPKNRLVRQIQKVDNTLYFLHSGAICIYDIPTQTLKNFSQFGESGITNATVFFIDSQKRLWVGATNGLSLYHPETESFTHYEFEKSKNRPLGTYFMALSIYEHQNKLWVGTFNSGLWTLDLNKLNNPVIKNITAANGLPDNTVYATLPDASGNMWMSTNQGISKFNLSENQFLNFSVLDGLQHEEFNRLAFTKCKNGDLVFGGINGINIFNAEQITVEEDDYTPKIITFAATTAANITTAHSLLSNKKIISLKAEQNNISAQFFIPNFHSPKRYEVFYKLENYNPDWIKVESNELWYPNLRPGSYELKVKTVSTSGVEKQTSVSFYVHYPLWQTWWFILLAMMLLTSAIYIIIRHSIAKTKQDKVQLEKLLRLRTLEIERSREELANLNQKKDVIFSILSHDLRSPLTTLKGFLSLLIENSEYLSKEDIKKHATSIRNSVTSSLDLIDNTLFWSLSQTGNITYTPTNFSLQAMLKKIKDLYELTAEKKHINFSIHCEEDLMLNADENMIYVTLRNLVSNALKFTSENKTITITATKNNSWAEIIVKDEGIGMNQTYLDKLLTEEHLQVKMGTSNEKGTGLGIALCKKFITLNKGELKITSEEGKGSVFIVRLPLAYELVEK
jgi:signal transduction histidine kinase/ligand-binding sensor domain-containing protein